MMINRYLQNGLQGKYAHYQTDLLFNGLSWEMAGEKPEGSPHSVWELLFHMNYWQEFILAELREEAPESPKDLSEASKDSLEEGIGGRKRTPADLLMVLINHNSYHGGQVVYARRLISAWPPPDGDEADE